MLGLFIVYDAEGQFDRLYSNVTEAGERAGHIGGSVETWGVIPRPSQGTKVYTDKGNGDDKSQKPGVQPAQQPHPTKPGR